MKAVGIVPFHRIREDEQVATLWIRNSSALQIRKQLTDMGVAGIVDTVELCSWNDRPQDAESVSDIPLMSISEMDFVENQLYYVVWTPNTSATKASA